MDGRCDLCGMRRRLEICFDSGLMAYFLKNPLILRWNILYLQKRIQCILHSLSQGVTQQASNL